MDADRIYLSLVIPAYNEAFRICDTLAKVENYLKAAGESYEIILVDDGSTDGTLEAARVFASGSESVRIVTYMLNRGKGYAVRQGVMASGGEYVAFTDADLSAPIEELEKLFAAIRKGYDIAIGSRAVRGAELRRHQPYYRELGGKLLNLAIQLLAVPGIKDTQCGFKLFRGDLARKIFSVSLLDGWGFDVEALYVAKQMGFTVAEIPVIWSHAEGSKIRPFSAGLQVLRDLIRIRTHRYEI